MNGETDSTKPLPDYYAVLGVAADADGLTIERAYEKLARKYQPYPDEPPLDAEQIRRLNEAFDLLDVPERRAAYDLALAAAGQTPAPPRRRLLDRQRVRVTIAACALGAAIVGIVAVALVLTGGGDSAVGPTSFPLAITAPLQGATVTSPVTVEVTSTNLIAEPELNLPDAAHYHLFVDKLPFTAAGQVIPMNEEGIYHFVESSLTIELEPGFHTLIVALGDNSHVRMHGPEAPAVAVDVTVVEPTPAQ
jgi:hypothetical protein